MSAKPEIRPVRTSTLAGDRITVSTTGHIRNVYDSQGNIYTERGGCWAAENAWPLTAGADTITIVPEPDAP